MGPKWKCSQKPMKPPERAELARKRERAVARRRTTEPRPLSSAICTKSRLYQGVGVESMKSTALTVGLVDLVDWATMERRCLR